MNSRTLKLLRVQILIVTAGVLLLTAPAPILRAASAEGKSIEKSIQNAYRGKTLSLRHFYIGRILEFDSNGGVLKGPKVGPWTLYSQILVNGIKLKSQSLEIDAKRLFLHYLAEEKKFQAFRDGDVRIHIDLDREPSSTQDLEPLLAKIFVKPGEDFSELAPSYWREFCSHMNDRDWSEKEVEKARAEDKTRAKEGIEPVPVRISNPEYSKMAREAKITGSLALSVGIDEYGHVSDVVLIRPLGMGLDENAVENVRTWTFRPAQLNGHVRAVKVLVEVSFSLF